MAVVLRVRIDWNDYGYRRTVPIVLCVQLCIEPDTEHVASLAASTRSLDCYLITNLTQRTVAGDEYIDILLFPVLMEPRHNVNKGDNRILITESSDISNL